MPHVKITLNSIQCLSTTDNFLEGSSDELRCLIENRQVYVNSGQNPVIQFGNTFKVLGTSEIGDFSPMQQAQFIGKVLFDADVDPADVPYGLYLLFFDEDNPVNIEINGFPISIGGNDDIGIIGFRVIPFEAEPAGIFFPQVAYNTKSTPFPGGDNVNGIDYQIEGSGGKYSLWLKGEIS
ncbi:MAG: hypothetical protein ABIY70_17775 [Capsulimonas sp.]|uniref:hypothetical protein n=1 Tax=Capsulimonas sp. TaxID=2494211 RepID=UPI003264BA54